MTPQQDPAVKSWHVLKADPEDVHRACAETLRNCLKPVGGAVEFASKYAR